MIRLERILRIRAREDWCLIDQMCSSGLDDGVHEQGQQRGMGAFVYHSFGNNKSHAL